MKRLYTRFLQLEAILAGFCLVAMTGMVLTGGVARMLKNPLNWTIDLATACFAWAVFLCADIAWRNSQLMSMELFTERLPRKVQSALNYINFALISAFLAYGIWYGTTLAWASRARSFNGIPWISYSWVTMSITVGCALMLLTTILKVRDAMRADGILRSGAAEGAV